MSKLLDKELFFHVLREVLWLIVTAMLTAVVLYPITQKIDFIYWKTNALFIFITITYFRYAVNFRSHIFLRPGWVRFLLFTANLCLFFFILGNLQKFMAMADNFYIEDFGFPKVIMYENVKQDFFKYLYKEIVFFGTSGLLMILALELRIIIAYWQLYKHNANIRLQD
jgi:hypothetical protein